MVAALMANDANDHKYKIYRFGDSSPEFCKLIVIIAVGLIEWVISPMTTLNVLARKLNTRFQFVLLIGKEIHVGNLQCQCWWSIPQRYFKEKTVPIICVWSAGKHY